jgi:hypothetical protein
MRSKLILKWESRKTKQTCRFKQTNQKKRGDGKANSVSLESDVNKSCYGH